MWIIKAFEQDQKEKEKKNVLLQTNLLKSNLIVNMTF